MASKLCGAGRLSAAVRWMLLGISLLAAPLWARGENNCPWMNEATASDLVGGDAVGAYGANAGKSATCTFIESVGKASRVLQISVESADDSHADYLSELQAFCRSAPTPLKAIGNEAAICPFTRRRRVTVLRALGRVRNQVFIVALSTSVKGDPILTRAMLEMKIGAAAEQVAGNLF